MLSNINEHEDYLFALSDIIDDQNINKSAIIKHLMYVWERIVGKTIDKIDQLTFNDIQNLQKDLNPLISTINSQNQNINSLQPQLSQQTSNQQLTQSIQSMPNLYHQQSFKELEQTYYQKLKYLELKLKAYKQEYVKAKSICKQQDKLISKYEQAIKQLSQKKDSIQKQQDLKNQIFESFLHSLKSDYNAELQKIKGLNSTNLLQQQNIQLDSSQQQHDKQYFNDRSRSISPININDRSTHSININFSQYEPMKQENNNKAHTSSRQIQTDKDEKYVQLLELEQEYQELQLDYKNQQIEKKELLKEKSGFNEKLSLLQEKYSQLQEKLDSKTQKYKNIKLLQRENQQNGTDNLSGLERLQEELDLLQKQKLDADTRTKKFEDKFRSGLKEINELREQVEQLQQQLQAKDNDMDFDRNLNIHIGNGAGTDSQSSSFVMFNQPNVQQDLRINELEKEKEFLLQKINLLEKNNKELLLYKKSLDETIDEISKEQDIEKRMQLVNINLIRRKSLLRLETSPLFSQKINQEKFNLNSSPEKVIVQNSQSSKILPTYHGQKQSTYQQYTPGNKNTQMFAPNTLYDVQQQQNLILNQIPSPEQYQTQTAQQPHNDLHDILDQIQRLDSIRSTPAQRTPSNIQQQDIIIEQQHNRLSHSNNNSHRNSYHSQRSQNSHKSSLSTNEVVMQSLFQPSQRLNSSNGVDERQLEMQQLKDTFVNQQSNLYEPQQQNNNKTEISQQVIDTSDSYDQDQDHDNNIFVQQLKKQITKKQEEQKQTSNNKQATPKGRNINVGNKHKSIIKEEDFEDEYDDEESSSSSEEQDNSQDMNNNQ